MLAYRYNWSANVASPTAKATPMASSVRLRRHFSADFRRELTLEAVTSFDPPNAAF
jgi:hypothetical protein